MGNRVIIAGHRMCNLMLFEEQLRSILGQDLNIVLAAIKDSPQIHISREDVVLVTCHDVYKRLFDGIPTGAKVIIAGTTFQMEALRKLRDFVTEDVVLVVQETIEKASQLILNLLQWGITQLRMEPADLSDPTIFKGRIVMISGMEESELAGAEQVIDLRPPILDLTAVLDVALELGKEELLTTVNIRKSFLDFAPVHRGISWTLENSNRFKGAEEAMLELMEGAAISIAQDGMIQRCNAFAAALAGISQQEAAGQSGITLFPQIPFREVLENEIAIKDSLCIMNDETMILSVKPVLNSGKRYGAVAVLKRFKDEERRHNKFRTSLIGRGYRAKYRFDDIIGTSAVMRQCLAVAKRMASSGSSVLLCGESGTGKEMFAQAIHNASARASYQFVAVNCGAIPETLLESELFGYEEGAFTGARKGGKPGLFELAHKGTLFLDEIAEMHLTLQKRLLRVLQEREVVRLGGDSVITVDVRLIAATNQDLLTMVRAGTFREDLYYRLSVLPLSIPPLRQRRGDIFLLAEYFKKRLSADFFFSAEVQAVLEEHSWPGNVRELENYIEYFMNLGVPQIALEDLALIMPEPGFVHGMGKAQNSFAGGADGVEASDTGGKMVFILRQLEQAYREGRRLGRRSISAKAREAGIFLGEQEVRQMLLQLQEQGYVEIHPTKAGTTITRSGMRFLNEK